MITGHQTTRATIVLPTYNERDNILSLLDALRRTAADLSVLVVDDSSPDGTGDLVRRRAAADHAIALLSRPKKDGLGAAYTAAFTHLLGSKNCPDIIIQMDADFSHDPKDVPRLCAALDHADLAIGSRYVPGGSVTHWNGPRRVLSRGANAAARFLTNAGVRDLTGGFNAWRAVALAAVRPTSIQAGGYGYLLELKVRAARLGARIVELPITFTERREGASKMNAGVALEALGVLLNLARHRNHARNTR